MIPLSTIRDSFEGVIPSLIATTDSDGMPNITSLSHVYYVDERHVALSNQYFSKTAANVAANGLATVMVVDGYNGNQHILDLVFESSRSDGDVFDRVCAHLDVMSAEQGMDTIMKLRAVDIYRVEDCRLVMAANPLEQAPEKSASAVRDHLQWTEILTARLTAETDIEQMLDRALEGLAALFGYSHAMVLLPDTERMQLTTIASHGYDRYGIGSEIPFGQGTIGKAAATRLPVRISDMSRGRRYVQAVKAMSGMDEAIALPAISSPVSQLAVPMIAQRRLMGVLFVESDTAFAFRHKDEEALLVIARQLALALMLADPGRDRSERPPAPTAPPAAAPTTDAGGVKIRYYRRDGSVFVDGDYLIRGVPGRLLKHCLDAYLATGQRDFTNREIRRDPGLLLPDFKDNLETRLILLRRRLEEKGGPIRLVRADRGRLRLDIDGVPHLTVIDGD